MFNAIWRFLVYRFVGGRILLALTVLNWLRRRLATRQTEPPLRTEPPRPAPRVTP